MPCSQEYIQEKNLEKQILDVLETIEMPQELSEIVIEQLKVEFEEDIKGEELLIDGQKKALTSCSTKLDNLMNMRINQEINEQEFIKKRNELMNEKARLEELIRNKGIGTKSWLDKAIEAFNFARDAKNAL